MGFEATLNAILQRLPKQRRTGLFSATQTGAPQPRAPTLRSNPALQPCAPTLRSNPALQPHTHTTGNPVLLRMQPPSAAVASL